MFFCSRPTERSQSIPIAHFILEKILNYKDNGTRSPIPHPKVEPLEMSHSITVGLYEQIVCVGGRGDDVLQVATFKGRVKAEITVKW